MKIKVSESTVNKIKLKCIYTVLTVELWKPLEKNKKKNG